MPSRKRILIVDDDPQVHKMLDAVLTSKNYEVASSMSAGTALHEMKSKPADLVILDIMMPDMSGIELCRQIRGDLALKGTRILMLSAKDTQNDRLKGLQYGADDYVTKPFHVSTLVHKIDHMLNKS